MYPILIFVPGLSLYQLGKIAEKVQVTAYDSKGILTIMVFNEDHEREITSWLFDNFFN